MSPPQITLPLRSVAPPRNGAASSRINRMGLDAITDGAITGPMRLLVYGVEGVGKSSCGACAPAPVFLGPEDGLENLGHVKRFPEPHEWQDVLDAVESLIAKESAFKTLVVDTVDWIEPLLWAHICKQDGKASIEDFGYGKGYTKALDGWRVLLSLLERLRKTRGMNIILLAHCHVKTWKNPEGEDFDRYMLKIHDKAAGLLKEWVAAVLFANYETFADKDKRTQRVKGISTGERYLYTERTAAYDAKNRFNLPPQIRLDWDELEAAIRAGEIGKPEDILASIEETLAKLADETLTAQVRGAIAKAPGDASRLARINDRLNTRVAAEPATIAQES